MYLTRHQTLQGAQWASDGRYLPADLSLSLLLQLPAEVALDLLAGLSSGPAASDPLLPPVDANQEVWASGVTYLRSRDAREAESAGSNVYNRVYEAERPELFLKAPGWRAVGHGQPVRIRRDSRWNVPEPELVLVVNQQMRIVGYTAGDDVSSRYIEGENPLYLPQAKVYDGACALGPGIVLAASDELRDIPIRLHVTRGGAVAFDGEISTGQMSRGLEELVEYLGRELAFPSGALLMTGTGIVPPDDFTLQAGDSVEITVGQLTLENSVES